MSRIPSIFVSHGLPPMALQDDPYNTALVNFGRQIAPELKGIVCVSSQWVQPGPIQITTHSRSFIQHNFQGFQKELYEMNYLPPSNLGLTEEVAELLQDENFEVTLTNDYGFDYGVWLPLRLIRPEADVPVVEISLPMFEDPRQILKLGHALSSLRERGILLMGSGMAALNSSKVVWYARGEDVQPKIVEFNDWLVKNLMEASIENLLVYRTTAPHAEFAHPQAASLLPLFFTMGSSLAGDSPRMIYEGYKYGATSLMTFCLSDKNLESGLLS